MIETLNALNEDRFANGMNRAVETVPPTPPATVTSGQGVITMKQWWGIAQRMKLSEREFQIVRSVFDDTKEVDIARELSISAHTVHTYLGRLYRKLGVSSRVQLVVRVFAEYVRLYGTRLDA